MKICTCEGELVLSRKVEGYNLWNVCGQGLETGHGLGDSPVHTHGTSHKITDIMYWRQFLNYGAHTLNSRMELSVGQGEWIVLDGRWSKRGGCIVGTLDYQLWSSVFEHIQRTIVNHDIGSSTKLGLGLRKGSNDIFLFGHVCLNREGLALSWIASRTGGDGDFVAFRGKFGRDGLEKEVGVRKIKAHHQSRREGSPCQRFRQQRG